MVPLSLMWDGSVGHAALKGRLKRSVKTLFLPIKTECRSCARTQTKPQR